METNDILKNVILLNKKYIYFKDTEVKLSRKIAEILEKLPQIIAQSGIYISLDLEVHAKLKELFEKYVIIQWQIDDENTPWLIFKSIEDKELGRVQIGDEHSFNKQLWEEEFHKSIFLPSIEILIQNFFYLVNLEKKQSSHKD